jgi:hypothetical protein
LHIHIFREEESFQRPGGDRNQASRERPTRQTSAKIIPGFPRLLAVRMVGQRLKRSCAFDFPDLPLIEMQQSKPSFVDTNLRMIITVWTVFDYKA